MSVNTRGDRSTTFIILLAGLLVGVGLAALLLFGFGLGDRLLGGWRTGLEGGAVQSPALDQPAPDFVLETLAGGQVRLSDLRGQPVLINFWATWCGPCVLEMPLIEKFSRQYPEEFKVLAVNAGEGRAAIQPFVDELGLTFDILLDPENRLQSLYRLRGYPTSFIVDADGVIRVHQIGPFSEAQLEEYLHQVGVGE